MQQEQLTLQLFEPLSFDELIKRKSLKGVSVTINNRMRRGWQVRIKRFSGDRELIVPPYLEDAPADIKMALIQWATIPVVRNRTRKLELNKLKKSLELQVWNHIEGKGIRLHSSRFNPETFGSPEGCVVDLRDVFESVNREYFDGTVDALIRWGSRATTTSYQSNKTTKDGKIYHCITIAGAYNHKDVPRYTIEAVMYHEILHIVIPPYNKNGRRVVHSKEFTDAEKKFRLYKEWRHWERENLRAIARKIRRSTKGVK